MKLLFLSPRIPYPPDRGDKVRSLFILKTLAARGELTLVCFVEPKSDQAAISYIKSNFPDVHCIPHSSVQGVMNLILNILSKTPFQVAYYRNKRMQRVLDTLFATKQFDLVYTHMIRMIPYVQKHYEAKVIIDYCDCVSLEYKRSIKHRQGIGKLFFSIEAQRTERYELAMKDVFDENWMISPVDLKALKMEHNPNSIVLPNMVQIPDSQPVLEFQERIIFTGNMSVAHNISAATIVSKEIMPLLLTEYPRLKFYIVGAAPVPQVQALNNMNNTVVLGFVPDLYKELQKSDVFIAPLHFSAGIQNKILEAMACSIPVLSTANVAESLDCTDGKELLCAVSATDFAQKTLVLLRDGSLRSQIGKNGYEFVKQRFSSEAITSLINQRIDLLLNN